jgi:hypothetical protein
MRAQLPPRSDEAFVEQAFRLARDHLGVRTRLTPAGFMARGCAELKVLLLADAARACAAVHAAAAKRQRLSHQLASRPVCARQARSVGAMAVQPRAACLRSAFA